MLVGAMGRGFGRRGAVGGRQECLRPCTQDDDDAQPHTPGGKCHHHGYDPGRIMALAHQRQRHGPPSQGNVQHRRQEPGGEQKLSRAAGVFCPGQSGEVNPAEGDCQNRRPANADEPLVAEKVPQREIGRVFIF